MANARPVNISGKERPPVHNSEPEVDNQAEAELDKQASLAPKERVWTGDNRIYKLPGGAPVPGTNIIREDH